MSTEYEVKSEIRLVLGRTLGDELLPYEYLEDIADEIYTAIWEYIKDYD